MPMAEFQALVTEAKKEIFEINVSDLKRMLQSREDFCLIGVRTKRDADQGMIRQAVNVSRGMLEHDIDQVTTKKNSKIVLYCGGGSRSALKRMGFRNVISLAGGYKGWKE